MKVKKVQVFVREHMYLSHVYKNRSLVAGVNNLWRIRRKYKHQDTVSLALDAGESRV